MTKVTLSKTQIKIVKNILAIEDGKAKRIVGHKNTVYSLMKKGLIDVNWTKYQRDETGVTLTEAGIAWCSENIIINTQSAITPATDRIEVSTYLNGEIRVIHLYENGHKATSVFMNDPRFQSTLEDLLADWVVTGKNPTLGRDVYSRKPAPEPQSVITDVETVEIETEPQSAITSNVETIRTNRFDTIFLYDVDGNSVNIICNGDAGSFETWNEIDTNWQWVNTEYKRKPKVNIDMNNIGTLFGCHAIYMQGLARGIQIMVMPEW